MESITGRVDRLEDLMAGLIEQARITQQQIAETNARIEGYIQSTQQQIDRLSIEMKAFKDEMRDFKDEMRDFKDEMRDFKDEMRDFKDEMKDFKDEMKDFKDEMLDFKEWSKRNIEDLNLQWGNLANKMGTLVEDIFSPSIDQAIQKHFRVQCDIIDTNKLIRKGKESLELDILALSRETKQAFIVEVKSSPDRIEYIDKFIEKLKRVPQFLPELEDYTLIGIYAGLNMNEETVNILTQKKLYAMIVKGDILEIVNLDKVKG